MKQTSQSFLFLAAISEVSKATTSSSAAIGLSMSEYNLDYKTDYTQSVVYEANTNYDPCLCNLTP